MTRSSQPWITARPSTAIQKLAAEGRPLQPFDHRDLAELQFPGECLQALDPLTK